MESLLPSDNNSQFFQTADSLFRAVKARKKGNAGEQSIEIKLTLAHKAIYSYFTHTDGYCKKKGIDFNFSIEHMSSFCTVCIKTFQRALATLERLGLVTVERKDGAKNKYTVHPLNVVELVYSDRSLTPSRQRDYEQRTENKEKWTKEQADKKSMAQSIKDDNADPFDAPTVKDYGEVPATLKAPTTEVNTVQTEPSSQPTKMTRPQVEISDVTLATYIDRLQHKPFCSRGTFAPEYIQIMGELNIPDNRARRQPVCTRLCELAVEQGRTLTSYTPSIIENDVDPFDKP